MNQPVKALIDGELVSVTGPLNSLKLPKEALFAKVKYSDPKLCLDLADPDQLEVDAAPAESEWKLTMLSEPILGDCEVHLATLADPEAQVAFWHSSAHILGYAIEQVFDEALLTIGPPVKEGFFYDFQGPIVHETDYKSLEKAIKSIIKKNY